MLENLRNEASFHEEEEPPEVNAPKPPKPPKIRRSIDQVTGMTAQQRFVLAVMLLFIICLMGVMLVLIAGKVVPPFLS